MDKKNAIVKLGLYFIFLTVSSCVTHHRTDRVIDKIDFHNYSETSNSMSVKTGECSWIYKGKELDKKQIDSVKNVIYANPSVIKMRTVSSSIDTLEKYKIKKPCVVILE